MLAIVGIPGNILSVLVLRRKFFRKKSYSQYLTALAIFDTLVLMNKCYLRLTKLLDASTKDLKTNDIICKLHSFFEHLIYLMASWLVLCISVERFLAIWFPFLRQRFFTSKRATIVVIIMFFILSYTQIFRLIHYGAEDSKFLNCISRKDFEYFYLFLHVYVYQLVLQFAIPLIVVTTCNALVLFKLKNPSIRMDSRSNVSPRTTLMLVMISLIHVLTLAPVLLLTIIIHVSINVDLTTAELIFDDVANVKYILELLSEVNFSANFYIYLLSTSRFRREMMMMLHSRSEGVVRE